VAPRDRSSHPAGHSERGAYAQRAQIHEVYEWEFPAADEDFRRTVALSPGSAEAFMRYAQFLNVVGLDDSALTVMQRAVALSPDVSLRVANLTPRLRMVGRRAEAAVEARRGSGCRERHR
jgi:Tfp pilus assembly protein PilF